MGSSAFCRNDNNVVTAVHGSVGVFFFVYTTTIANDKPNAPTVACVAHSYPSIPTQSPQ